MKTIKLVSMLVALLMLTSYCGNDPISDLVSSAAKKPVNVPPVANAGPDQTITLPVNTVALDGTGSSDKDGRISSWKWTKKSGPTQYTLTAPTSSKTNATSLVEGVYVFTLTITDNKDAAASDDVQVTVLKGVDPPPTPTLTGFSPTSGLVGTSVTITGTNFSSPTVSFNGTAATVASSTSTSITTTVPSGATTGNITVTTGGTTLTSSSPFTVTTQPPPPVGDTYFQGDMSAVTVSKTSSGYKLNGWPELYAQVKNIYLNDLSSSTLYAYQEMVQDPAGSGRQVMMGRIINDDPTLTATSRAQMTVNYSSTMNIPVYHTSHRMYIHPDLKYLEQYNGIADWFSLAEIWTIRDPNMDGDPAGSARWGLSLHKGSAVGSPLYWHLYGQYMQPASMRFQNFWEYDNKAYAVPFGQWITLDIYLVRGEGAAGQFKITVTPDGGTPTTVFNVNGTTMYPSRPDLYLDSWQPFKLYIGNPWLSWMTNNGKYMAIYYNDYKWYKN